MEIVCRLFHAADFNFLPLCIELEEEKAKLRNLALYIMTINWN